MTWWLTVRHFATVRSELSRVSSGGERSDELRRDTAIRDKETLRASVREKVRMCGRPQYIAPTRDRRVPQPGYYAIMQACQASCGPCSWN